MVTKEVKNVMVGGLAGTAFDLVIDFPLVYTLGYVPTWEYRDAEGRYVWGVGLGDALTASIGAGLYIGGRMRSEVLEYMGLGWLLALGIIKLGELYNYLKQLYPVPTTPPLAVGATSTAVGKYLVT